MSKPVTALALFFCLAACTSGETEVPAENLFSGQTQSIERAKETAAAVEQAQGMQQQQIQRQTGQ